MRIHTRSVPLRHHATVARRSVAVGVVAAAITMVTAAAAAAGSGPVRSDPLAAIPGARASDVAARAAAVSDALGLPAGHRTMQRIVDPIDGRTFDEVTTVDAAGRPVSIVRLGLDGRPTLAVRLGLRAPTAAIARGAAIARASAAVRSAGLSAPGTAIASPVQATGGWTVTWPRVVAGAAVRGDGIRVGLWADGTFHSLSRSEQVLAPAPAVVASESAVRDAAARFAAARFGPAAADLHVSRATTAWVVPNHAFDDQASPPSAPARLAWVVELRPSGTLTDHLTALEIWLDAGSLAVLGGDVAA